MCGIYGMVSLTGAPLQHPEALRRMAASLRHRGPDDPGLQRATDAAFGCERLRITDPRPEASQPFVGPTGRVWLLLNGAIYNASALRRRFPRFPFRSRSDVEPVLPLYVEGGDAWVDALDGMFALAVWETDSRRLVLARDRAGEKPLFYVRVGEEVWFASEVRGLLCHPAVGRAEDHEAIAQFLALGYIGGTRTAFRHIRKVAPGTVHTFTRDGERVWRYWKPETIAPVTLHAAAAADRLDVLLHEAVERQLEADVPVGIFTSGGVDSSLLTALASRDRRHRVTTFAVGFPTPSYDERVDARYVAALFGTRHVEIEATDAALGQALDAIVDHLAEPLADPAILPTYLLAREARHHVGVVLGGEGADELFGGYPTYVGHRLARLFARLPAPLAAALAAGVRALPASSSNVPLEFLLKRFVKDAHRSTLERHLAWFGTGLLPSLRNRETVVEGALDDARCRLHGSERTSDPVQVTTLFDYLSYLPDDLLLKMDRSTMFHSLEARAPYLDRAVASFALGLPAHFKVRGLATKRLLKHVASRYVPPAVVYRRKRGLGVPVAGWLAGGLRAEVDRMLAMERDRPTGVLDGARFTQLVSEHRAHHANHARALWAWLIYRRWRERWLGDRT